MKTRLDHFFHSEYMPLKLRGRRPRTIALYETTLRTFGKFLGRAPIVADLNDDCVTKFLMWFRLRGRTPQSVNKEHANLTAIWRFACRRHKLTDWPTVPREPEPEREPRAWLEHEIRQLFEAVQQERAMIGKVKARDWWRALLLLLWDSGERIGAAMAIRWQDVDLVNGWLHVPAEVRKGGSRDRVYKLSPETVAAMRAIKKSPGLCFPWPYCKTYLWTRMGIICERAGLPSTGRDKFHRVRRTVASYYEAAGGNATELLGHSSRKVTKAYLDKRIVGVPDATSKLFRLA